MSVFFVTRRGGWRPAACGLGVWPAANFEMRPAANERAACGRWVGWPAAKYWVACGQKSGKIWVENLRKYFRGVFVVSALFSQSDCLSFWIAKRRGRGERDENWLAARALVFMSHRTDERASGEASQRLELSRARRREAKPNHGNRGRRSQITEITERLACG